MKVDRREILVVMLGLSTATYLGRYHDFFFTKHQAFANDLGYIALRKCEY
jgi:hypothetical protein